MIAGNARRLSILAATALLGACAGSGLPDPEYLAKDPPLPYSVLVTGGAFLDPEPADVAPLARTYRPDSPYDEAFSLGDVVHVLQEGRVFVRVEKDERAAAVRRRLAETAAQEPADTLTSRSRANGHDLVLVLEGIRDDKIEVRGVNGQWPITAAAWLLIGIGLVIPDHTYEPQASLRISLREPETGHPLFEWSLKSTPIDVSLVERTGWLGLLTSIVVPPFLVSSDDEAVAETVREVASQRLLVEMAGVLKEFATRERLRTAMPAEIEVTAAGDVVAVRVRSADGLALVRLRTRGALIAEPLASEFEAELLQSAQESRAGPLVYTATLPRKAVGDTLQVLVQTITGRIASTTVPLQ